MPNQRPTHPGLRLDWYQIIFESDTPAGRAFDLVLLWAILLSVAVVMLESVSEIARNYGPWLKMLEWVFTGLFTLEYLARLFAVRSRKRYLTSFFGIVDLLAVIPTYLSLVITGSQFLIVIRILRLLRVFRVLKLVRYVGEAQTLLTALQASRPKITVFLLSVSTLVTIMGTLMYLVEGGTNGFTSIPRSIYWAIVTLTTVGYGDIAPKTVPGQALSSLIMITGYAILAVPTGIVTVELAHLRNQPNQPNQPHQAVPTIPPCPACGAATREPDARFCKICGTHFTDSDSSENETFETK